MILDVNNVGEEQFKRFENGIKLKLFSLSNDINEKFVDCLVVLKQLIELLKLFNNIFDEYDIVPGLQSKIHNIVNIQGKDFFKLTQELHLLIEKTDFISMIKDIYMKKWSGKRDKDNLTKKESDILKLLFGNDSIEDLVIDMDTL